MCRSISQSGNRTEAWDWTLKRIDRCLPAHRYYCEAAARSVIVNITVWEACFRLVFLSPEEESVFPREKGRQTAAVDFLCMTHWPTLRQLTSTVCIFPLAGGEHRLSLWWLCEKLWGQTIWFIDLNEFIYQLLIYATLGAMFIFLRTCWIPSSISANRHHGCNAVLLWSGFEHFIHRWFGSSHLKKKQQILILLFHFKNSHSDCSSW